VRVVENVCIRREKREEKVPNDGKKFLCVGRNLFLKNIPMVHEIFAKLSQEGVGAEVVVLQNVPREEVFAVLAHARALIIPSFSEVSPNLALEALACGTPVILTQDCGMKERLADAVLWIDSRDPLSLERAVRACCDEREYSFLKEKVESFSFSRTYVDVARDFEEMLQDKK
jgi:glycosyltransferase involved in cell wall biosynthesis